MKNIEFIVYKYTFDNGGYYYGRTRTDTNRLGNISGYKNQYVYKVMKLYPNFKIDIIYRTSNPFLAYKKEYELISQNIDDILCYNAANEDEWYQKVYKDISSKTLDYNPDDLLKDLCELQ